ncbi:MAG TPA: Imm32 family immunity protein [Coleofasciculaceae cyanobacterium]|jgi:hypothetical protein
MIFVQGDPEGVVDVIFDKVGLDDLKIGLSHLEKKPDHTHFFSPTFGGWELSEEEPSSGKFVVHKLTLRRVESSPEADNQG